jgi:hypothetical protein
MLWDVLKVALTIIVPAYFALLRHRETVRGQVAQAQIASEKLMLESRDLADHVDELTAENLELRQQVSDLTAEVERLRELQPGE